LCDTGAPILLRASISSSRALPGRWSAALRPTQANEIDGLAAEKRGAAMNRQERRKAKAMGGRNVFDADNATAIKASRYAGLVVTATAATGRRRECA
jgi:hypothetical protein